MPIEAANCSSRLQSMSVFVRENGEWKSWILLLITVWCVFGIWSFLLRTLNSLWWVYKYSYSMLIILLDMPQFHRNDITEIPIWEILPPLTDMKSFGNSIEYVWYQKRTVWQRQSEQTNLCYQSERQTLGEFKKSHTQQWLSKFASVIANGSRIKLNIWLVNSCDS